MAIIVQHRCHACGAACKGQRAPWVHCPFCEAPVAYDLSAWFESAGYATYLRRAPALADRWQAYQGLTSAAREAGLRGDREAYRESMRAACELMLELMPHTCPPRAQRDAGYRRRYLDWQVWWMEQQDLDPEIAALVSRMQAILTGIDHADPLPTLERAMELSRQLHEACTDHPDRPPDPDGMPPAARLRITLAMLASGYYPTLQQEARGALLQRIYGADNVRVVDGEADEMALFAPWTCPRCGLVSLQARTALQLTCVACYHQRPRAEEEERLEALQTRCADCGAEVTLPAGALDHRCPFCAAVIWRMVRTWQAERDYAREIMRQHGGEPGPGQEGLPLSESNRRQLVIAGLGRQACYYWRYLSPWRLLELARASLPDEPALRPALEEALRSARDEGCEPGGLELIRAAMELGMTGR